MFSFLLNSNMVTDLTLPLIACLLQGALCGQFQAFVPQTIEVLNGSCVTIPCSFDIEDRFSVNLDRTCKAMWRNSRRAVVFDSSNPQQREIKGELMGDLTQKDCTTTLNNMKTQYSHRYHFRIQCDKLRYNFEDQTTQISVRGDLGRPTLTPPTLKVKEGTSVTLTCSAPAPCLPLPPNLTWTPGLGQGQETLQDKQDKTKVKVSVLNFTASHLHHRQQISCTAVYGKQDGSTEFSVSSTLTADVTYAPKGTKVSISPSGPVQEGDNVTLTCSSSANPAVKNYTWYRADGDQETLTGTGPVLNITASWQSGPVFCQTENEEGAERSPSTHIDVQYAPKGTKVSISPSGPVREGDNVTLTCSSSANPAVKNYTWYRAGGDQETLIETGPVLNITASWESGPVFCQAENEEGAGRSPSSHIDVQFTPQILSSSDCNTTVNQVNCSCETIGNPPPILLWTLDGSPVNHSDKIAISYEHHSGTNVSFITMSQPQWRNHFTLMCQSSNSLGSASRLFYFYSHEPETNTESQVCVMTPIFKATIVVLLVLMLALLALVCALLCYIRAQKIQHNLLQKQNTDDASTVSMSQFLPSREGNEEPNKTVEDLNVNSNMLKPDVSEPPTISAADSTNTPSSGKNNTQEFTEGSDKKTEEDKDVIYTTVTWRRKGEKEGQDSGLTNLSSNSSQQTLYDNVKPRDVNKESECVYAQVKYKDNSDLQQ